MNIFEQELLLEVNVEQIKNTLFHRFTEEKGVPRDIVKQVYDIDPTKKKSYSYWLLNLWDTEERDSIIEGLRDGSIADLFESFRPGNVNSSLNLQAYRTLDSAMQMKPDVDNTYIKLGDPNSEVNQFDIVYDTPEWKIIVPHNYEASKKVGKGCKWCTAGGFGNERDPYYYNYYTGFGPLWINLDFSAPQRGIDDKLRNYTRYQFCFEFTRYNPTGEFMDYRDNRITKLSSITTMPEGVKEFYANINERYAVAVYGTESDRRAQERERQRAERRRSYEEERRNDGAVVKRFADGTSWVIMQEYNDDFTLLPHGNGAVYRLYNSGDIHDPISRTLEFGKEVVEDGGQFPYVVLKAKMENGEITHYFVARTTNGENLFFTYNDVEIEHEGDSVVFVHDYYYYYSENGFSGFLCFGVQKVGLNKRECAITSLKKNFELSSALNSSAVELKLSDGSSKIYVRQITDAGRIKFACQISDIPANGDSFTIENGFIEGKYGRYHIVGDDIEGFKFSAKLTDNLVIVKSLDATPKYNIFDSITRDIIFREWHENIRPLNRGCAIVADGNISHGAILFSCATKDFEMITNVTIEQTNYYKSYVGTILNGVKVSLPFSLSTVEFSTDTPQQESELNSFLGRSGNNIRESFCNFYKRLESSNTNSKYGKLI